MDFKFGFLRIVDLVSMDTDYGRFFRIQIFQGQDRLILEQDITINGVTKKVKLIDTGL